VTIFNILKEIIQIARANKHTPFIYGYHQEH